jgi:hypothetical protein
MLAGTLPLELTPETIEELASKVATEVREELRLAPPQPAASVDDLLTFEQLLKKGGGRFSAGQLRGWLMHRETNGLNRAVSKVGGRLYFDERLFVAWLFGRSR